MVKRIAIGAGGSERSVLALRWAVEEAAAHERVLELVTARESPDVFGEESLFGDPAAVLCARSADADLLVVGSRGRGGFARPLLGSVSNAWARPSRCPIAIVPGTHRDPDALTGS